MTTTSTESPGTPPAAAEPVVTVRDLRQSYGDFEAVRGVSFDIRPGELFALLGTNGAGKTTTVDVLEGLRRATSGTVRVFGHDPYGQPAALRGRTNAVLQGDGLLDDLTVAETVVLSRDLAADPRDPAEVMELVGLTDKRSVAVRQLSGGQKRRLALACALVTRPEVLYLDEPTTGMDPEGRHEIWRLLRDLKEQGTAILLTTHYLEEAERLADRLAIMHRGEIRVEGTLQGVLADWGDRIGFRMPEDVGIADLPRPADTSVAVETRDQALWAAYTVSGPDIAGRASAAVAELLAWAGEHGTSLQHLHVRGASLEDVFLRVAGDLNQN
ncbi:ABC transporter ATP-binding protein [Nocardiopsis algeriensis]|uniref:ABC-2 type transport system ATP-binding protein n=1 Tax=Nocardiopsis algeriensis TaxID=1478215 RepID=A0A841IK14_9ACTN|nr:ABC transporter ATP-binding protein [Nocardiopsis algeriensis]MBB6118402.1 ABC-2 type transport system ATP-binding protein [Nocardiopsis algeriensis]